MTDDPGSGSGSDPDPDASDPDSGRGAGSDPDPDAGAPGGERAPEDALDVVGHEREDPRTLLPDGALADEGAGGSGDAPDGPAGEAADPEDGEVEPVEILVQLAERGEIEPWDVDIVAVTDAFLAELDERDLRTGGRALFYASVLLRMKSDALLEADDPDEEEEETVPPWDAPFGDEGRPGADPGSAPGEDGDGAEWRPNPVDALEAEMDRRLERKDQRGTPETLDELIRDLREAERGSWWKASRTYDTEGPAGPGAGAGAGFGRGRGVQEVDYRPAGSGDDRAPDEPSRTEVTAATHEEDIEATIGSVRSELETHYGAGRREVLFAEVEDAGATRVETFLAVLFLAHRGTVTLEQDDLFGDLWVQDARAGTENESEDDSVAAD